MTVHLSSPEDDVRYMPPDHNIYITSIDNLINRSK